MNEFYYNKQIKRSLIQFMTLFSGMQVQVGKSQSQEERLIDVPIHYSSRDRVGSALLAGSTQNKPIRVPVISAEMATLNRNASWNPGANQVHASTYLPEGGFFASDVKTIERLRPVCYTMQVELAIWTSNVDQHYQILEQILPIFNPSVQLQTSDGRFDWTKISVVELQGMQFNNNYPIGGNNNQVMLSTLMFSMPIYLSVPADVQAKFVRDVLIRIGALDHLDTDISDAFDSMELKYTNVASADDLLAP